MHDLRPYKEARLTNAMITVMVIGNIIIISILMILFGPTPLA